MISARVQTTIAVRRCARHQTIVKLSRIISATCAISIKQIASAALLLFRSLPLLLLRIIYLFNLAPGTDFSHGYTCVCVFRRRASLCGVTLTPPHYHRRCFLSFCHCVSIIAGAEWDRDAFNLFPVASSWRLKFSNRFLCDYFFLSLRRRWNRTDWFRQFFRTWFPDDLSHEHKIWFYWRWDTKTICRIPK
jgi:hypothetical protein